MRGISLCSVTVKAGPCAGAAAAAAAPASRARRASPGLTSETVVQSQRESQWFARGHRLRHVHSEAAPVDAQAEIGQQAAERRQPVARQPPRSAADEPGLAGLPQHYEVRALEGDERL